MISKCVCGPVDRIGSSGRSIPALATEAGVTSSYVARVLRLGFLAPAVVTAIPEDRHPVELTAKRLAIRVRPNGRPSAPRSVSTDPIPDQVSVRTDRFGAHSDKLAVSPQEGPVLWPTPQRNTLTGSRRGSR